MTPPTDLKRALLVPLLALLVLSTLVAIPAIAAASKKNYTASFDSTNATAGTQVTKSLTLANARSSNQSFASARVKIPSGFMIVGTPTLTVPGTKVWQTPIVNLTTGKIELQSGAGSTSANAIAPGEAIVVSITATVPCATGPGEWTTQVKQSNDFSGNNNDFAISGNQPSLTVSGSCANKISFVDGAAPSNTTAGGAMSQVKVYVTNAADVPLNGNVVTLTGDIQNSGTVTSTTGTDGIAVFGTIRVSQTPKASASLVATEAGGQSAAGNFAITPATVAFDQQPTLTKFNATIAPAVSVRVSDGTNGIEGVPVTLSIGTNPAGGILAGPGVVQGEVTVDTGSDGVATFSGLSIGPNESVTSSGYQLLASIDSGTVLSDAFAISNTIAANCDPCTATFDGGSTITAPGGTTLIIENNDSSFCSTISNVIAGTVTIIPTGSGNKLLTFVDPHGNGTTPDPVVGDTYPVCKSQDGGGTVTLDYKNAGDRCDTVNPAPPCIVDQYFQIGSLDLVTKVLITALDPTMKR